MLMRAQWLYERARTPLLRTQWYRLPRRYYSFDGHNTTPPPTNPEDAQWFQKLRDELLNRTFPVQSDYNGLTERKKLTRSLSHCFPQGWNGDVSSDAKSVDGLPARIGEHLIFCNPLLDESKLLPDGTDKLHSPGDPYVRRMWAGGSLNVHHDVYFNENHGWFSKPPLSCSERIKDVRMRGQGKNEKIFVTIAREFARHLPQVGTGLKSMRNILLTEERNLVFMRERSQEELDEIKHGKIAPVKYLPSLGEPDISHALTPTRTMLFRFSALTFNAHLIHLDQDYARNVEGHRGLLVHGPLTLVLMLKVIGTHLRALDNPHAVSQIEYRNLAPLYCDEELRVCVKEKKSLRTDQGRTYEIWIEGPTGGLAVKGLVHSLPTPDTQGKPDYVRHRTRHNDLTKQNVNRHLKRPTSAHEYNSELTSTIRRHYSQSTSQERSRKEAMQQRMDQIFELTPFSLPATRQSTMEAPVAATSESSIVSPLPITATTIPTNTKSNGYSRRKHLRALRLRALERSKRTKSTPAEYIRAVEVPGPMKTVMSDHNREILERSRRNHREELRAVPLLRYYRTERPNFISTKFSRNGARKLDNTVVRKTSPSLMAARREKYWPRFEPWAERKDQ